MMSALAKSNLVGLQNDKAGVLMKAFKNACQHLGVSNEEAGDILGVNKSTLNRNSLSGFPLNSKTSELQLHFVRLYRSLFSIAGGDFDFMKHWYRTDNEVLNNVPAVLCTRIEGLIRTTEYLDAMRGKI
jgi:hypothetical protein